MEKEGRLVEDLVGEKLVVEFGVEKTVEREYGYAEKYLVYNGGKIDYKAIVKDGKVIAIVKKGYRLLENERVEKVVEEYVRQRNDVGYRVYKEGGKLFAMIYKLDGSMGVAVLNSVDGTWAFGTRLMISIGNGAYTVLNGRFVDVIYRKHTKNFAMENLSEAIDEMFKVGEQNKDLLGKLRDMVVSEEVVKTLEAELPLKYVKGAGAMKNMEELYKLVARRIWSENIKFVTKVELFRRLNDVVFGIAGIELAFS